MLTKGITYADLVTTFRKGQRNGNWRKLKFLDKALFRAAMGYAKRGGSIVNGMLVEKLLRLVARLKEISKGMRIFKRGYAKAVAMLDRGEEIFGGVFVWAPRLKGWLKDPDYIFWLGTNLFLNPFTSKSLYGKTLRGKKSFTNNFFYLR
uniref:Uncharacterized protein n=1 Tax=Candidatus Methanophagaceae archaeon ANME-1 ERB6 TaxID=2759912 RepID=A0A7G9Z0Z1_9EURY|nr:hypothetical protein NNHBGCAA_00025 [Methanosarcinales archaeon ANME-1 ERB6]